MAQAKNIVGVDHELYVYDQIETRQKVLGQSSNRDNESLTWINSKTSWVRCASAVNIADEEILVPKKGSTTEFEAATNFGATKKLKQLGLEGYPAGSALAKSFTLFAGTSQSKTPPNGGLSTSLRYGIIEKNTIYPAMESAYGLGGTEFGLNAMPGITGFTTTNLNRGALRVSNLKIRANNRQQFEYIETLYLRLGYTVFIEWGNTSYYTGNPNNPTYNSGPASEKSLMNEFINAAPKDQDTSNGLITNFYKRIEDLRESTGGNYDAVLGKVRNFNWNFNTDGTYDIDIEVISYGDIVESLTVNSLYSSTKVSPTKDGSSPKSSLEAFLDIAVGIQETQAKEGTYTIRNTEYSGTSQFKTKRSSSTKNYLSAKPLGSANLETADKIGYTRPKQTQGTVIAGAAVFGGDEPTGLASERFGDGYGREYRYVRLGDILDFINEKCLLYDDKGKNIVKIDTDESQDFIVGYSNGLSVSADPTKVMIRQAKSIPWGGTNINLTVFKTGKPQTDLEQFHYPVATGSNSYYCRILNLYFEINYLKGVLNKGEDTEEGKVSLFDFLTEILDTAGKCLGSINKFKIHLKDEQTLELYDEVRTVEYTKLITKNTKPRVFNLYGLSNNQGSFVRDMSLKSELTKEFSTLISVGAQARGTTVGEDATFFSRWNVGLVDRIVPKKLDKDEAGNSLLKKRQQVQSILDNYYELLLAYQTQSKYLAGSENLASSTEISTTSTDSNASSGVVIFRNFDLGSNIGESNINRYMKAQRDFFQLLTSLDAESQDKINPQVGFLPINLSITVDGLSGIKIFDELKINTKFLPKNYSDSLDFIVKTVSHEIGTDNQWLTKLETFSLPKTNDPSLKAASPSFSSITSIQNKFNLSNKPPGTGDSYIISTNGIVKQIIGKGPNKDGKFYLKDLDKILPIYNNSQDVQQAAFKFFNQLLTDPRTEKGYVFVITTGYRPVGENARVYGWSGVNFKSSHIFGMANDIVVYDQTKSGSKGKVIASKPYNPYYKAWVNLGIEDACKTSGLTWGWQYQGGKNGGDCVHFSVDGNYSGKALYVVVDDPKNPGTKVKKKVGQWRDIAAEIIKQLDIDLKALAEPNTFQVRPNPLSKPVEKKVTYKFPASETSQWYKSIYEDALNRLNLKDYCDVKITATEMVYTPTASKLRVGYGWNSTRMHETNPWPKELKDVATVQNKLGIEGI